MPITQHSARNNMGSLLIFVEFIEKRNLEFIVYVPNFKSYNRFASKFTEISDLNFR